MIKDVTLKLISIPLLGIFIPFFSGLFAYKNLSFLQLIISCFLFVILSFLIWQGNIFITSFFRNTRIARRKLSYKLFVILLPIASFTVVVASIFSIWWLWFFAGHQNNNTTLTFAITYTGFSLFAGLVYEILFLQKEVDLDSKIVDQLDLERQYAEMSVLKNELDPHFIFNSLTTLSCLISHDGEKAELFTNRLAQAYKYLLINKDRELITLEEELRFINNYFFLLQIRHDSKLKLQVHIDQEEGRKLMILPCALQILIENAIKHNRFTDDEPLVIDIGINKTYLYVSNNLSMKPYLVESTNIGLKNLSTRYKLTCNKDIIINSSREKFIVKLPLIKTSN